MSPRVTTILNLAPSIVILYNIIRFYPLTDCMRINENGSRNVVNVYDSK